MKAPITLSIDTENKLFLEENKNIKPSKILNDSITRLRLKK